MVLAYKCLEAHTFSWRDARDGLTSLSHTKFETLFAGFDWRRVRAVEARASMTIESVLSGYPQSCGTLNSDGSFFKRIKA